jgi:4'-phosphopantetheinyl transferase
MKRAVTLNSAARPRVPARERSLLDRDWTAGPAEPRLARHAVHVWRADLDSIPDGMRAYLSVDERARAARFPRELGGRRWAAARGVLRALLGRYLDGDPSALALRVDDHGRPTLAAGRHSVAFNVSHSGPIALLAFSATASVGVDVQVCPARPIDEIAIGRRALGAKVAGRLAALEPAPRARAFLRAWTRHEAALKLRGTGIWAARDVDRARLRAHRAWVAELDLGGEAAGAVALERSPSELRCWSWSRTGRASRDARDASAAWSDGGACRCGGL